MHGSRIVSIQGPTKERAALKFVLMIGVVSFSADFHVRRRTQRYRPVFGYTRRYWNHRRCSGWTRGAAGLRAALGLRNSKREDPAVLAHYAVRVSRPNGGRPVAGVSGKSAISRPAYHCRARGEGDPQSAPRCDAFARGKGNGLRLASASDDRPWTNSAPLFGPLVVALVLSHRGNYRMAFAVLVVPAVITYSMLIVARLLYPRPEDLHAKVPDVHTEGLPRIFWIYLAGAALVAAGFADFQLIAYHFAKADAVNDLWIPITYSIAMAVSGAGSLLFGRMFDRVGIGVLIPLTLISALFAPLVFLGGFWPVIVGSALWGLGTGVHESIVPAAVATMVPAQRRPSAYGLFTAVYGVAWFLGSAAMGVLYDRSVTAVVVFCVLLQLLAIPVFLKVRNLGRGDQNPVLAD